MKKRKLHDNMQYDTVKVKHLQIYKGGHLWLVHSEKSQESGHLEGRAGTEDRPLSFPSEAQSGRRSRVSGLHTMQPLTIPRLRLAGLLVALIICYYAI